MYYSFEECAQELFNYFPRTIKLQVIEKAFSFTYLSYQKDIQIRLLAPDTHCKDLEYLATAPSNHAFSKQARSTLNCIIIYHQMRSQSRAIAYIYSKKMWPNLHGAKRN